MVTPDVIWSLALCLFCIMLLIRRKRTLKMLLLIGALLLIITARIPGTI